MSNTNAGAASSSNSSAPAATTSKAPAELVGLMAHLQSVALERDHEITCLIAAMLSNQHVFMLGKPGIAKSLLIEAICDKIEGAKIFKRLFSATTERTELMGPFSLRELEQNDRIVHNTQGMLPESHVFFADEIFKANSQTLNDLLGLLNERIFDNGGTRIKTPLITCLAASNELPKDDALAALYDRFLVRLIVHPLNTEDSFVSLIQGQNQVDCEPISLEMIATWQKQVDDIEVTAAFAKNCYALREQLKLKHPELYISDRRFKQATKYVKARVFMQRGPGARLGKNDIVFLGDVLWSKPAELQHVQATISQLASAQLNQLKSLISDILVLINKGREHYNKSEGDSVLGTAKMLKEKAEALGKLTKDYPEEAEYLRPDLDKINEGRREITGYLKSVATNGGR